MVDGHNKSKLFHRAKTPDEKKCNCPKPSECPMSKNCLEKSVIYQATVKTSDKRPTQTYVGLTENEFKTRYTMKSQSFINFNNYEKRNCTELSKYIWNLKNNNISYSIKWKILKRAKSYNNASKRCNLCIWEKYFIILFVNRSLQLQHLIVATNLSPRVDTLINFYLKTL